MLTAIRDVKLSDICVMHCIVLAGDAIDVIEIRLVLLYQRYLLGVIHKLILHEALFCRTRQLFISQLSLLSIAGI